MNVLELFAGSRSFGKVAEQRGHNVFSVDWKQFDGIDLVIDIEDLEIPFAATATDIDINTHKSQPADAGVFIIPGMKSITC